MKTLNDSGSALAPGLAAIRTEHAIPGAFPPDVLVAAAVAARRVPDVHVDRTARAFVTLDPAGATDLDQAFAIEASGSDLLLFYAIADVAWFVGDGDPVDREAWRRGETLYLPDGKAPLYPPVLAEGAASLLPHGDRPAIVFAIRVGPDGTARLDGAERALIRSRAKLAYESVGDNDLPPLFGAVTDRLSDAEIRRGAARVDPPEQEVVTCPTGGYRLAFRPRLASEDRNAMLSLATNLAIAQTLLAQHTGLFRVMAEPVPAAVVRLRRTAMALGIDWPADMSLAALQRTLNPAEPNAATLMLAIRRAGSGASYAPYRPGALPWHAAIAAPYVHATAPLRRLADRYVIGAALAVANGRQVPDVVANAFEALPPVMARAEALAGRTERAVLDLAEAVLLAGREGETFPAVVIEADGRGAKIQLRDLAVVARVAGPGLLSGDPLAVRLTAVDAGRRTIAFEHVSEEA